MPKQDFSEYERRVSADHERQCRSTLTIHGVWRICPIRKCRRDKACSGEMLASAHQNSKIRAQRETGLSGNACAKLPRAWQQRVRQPSVHSRGVWMIFKGI
ncbi:hypothetical protein LP421_25545 [Rhizobium sp. RCAM05350]|nr:hypothetical protein LP421_25545 [Rhizobium sp. RCAM05350]